jgi:hypothetical protein
MRFSVLALDYDGTIARDGILDSEVRTAITEARASGIVVILVTGRILSDLRQVAGNLQFVDAVVAENGAVLAFPSGRSRLLGHPPPAVFVEELRRRGIDFKSGQCIVETDATSAPRILDVIRELELPLVLLFNREGKEFVFTDNGKPVETPARTLKELVALMPTSPLEVLDGHARREDFSRWIADVFHDHPLASDVRKVEQRYRLGHLRDLYPALTETIQERYEFSPDIMR